MEWEDIVVRLGLALILGSAIGLERQWRSHYVGLRTNTLLTIGATAMTAFAIAISQGDHSSFVHIIAGIITGVGFLGAGVIIQEGMNVKGVNTAATLWCSVAVGLFVGAGYFIGGTILAAFIILVNLFLRPIAYGINAKMMESKEADVPRDN